MVYSLAALDLLCDENGRYQDALAVTLWKFEESQSCTDTQGDDSKNHKESNFKSNNTKISTVDITTTIQYSFILTTYVHTGCGT